MMNRLKKMTVMIIALTMISGAFLVMVPQAGESSLVGDERYPDPIAVYADPEIRYRALNELRANAAGSDASVALLEAAEPLAENLPNGTIRGFIASDDTASTMEDYFYVESMEKRGEGRFCEVWVATDLEFSNPSDVRNPRMVITDDDVEYIIGEFDENIYPVMTETFMEAPEINGSSPYMPFWEEIWGYMGLNATEQNITEWLFPTNDTGKLMMMIFNIRDENYYDPECMTYIAGYYWSTMTWLYDRNIIHIDAYDWANRTGEQDESIIGHHSFVYESTVAHEYQHLLHDWTDGGEDTWVNEGLSMMAEPLCGYPIPYSYVDEYLGNTTNSLVKWGDQGGEYILADYGAAYMFMQYLYDHYGGLEMLQVIFNSPAHGTDSIDEAFLTMGHNRMTFEKVFRDWRLANLNLELDLDIPGGLYQYNTLEPEEIEESMDISHFVVRDNARSDDGSYVGAYGTDYIHVSGPGVAPFGWNVVDDTYWYSDNDNNMNTRLIMELDLTDRNVDTMRVEMQFSIESDFDFGYVQVSTDGGASWNTLQTLTGFAGYVSYDYSLSAYRDQEIQVGFLYSTDSSIQYDGWRIYEIYLDGYHVDVDDLYNPDSIYSGLDPAKLENLKFIFDGADEAPESWDFYGDFWYSGSGDELDRMLTMEVDLTAPASEEGDYLHWLNLTTYWEIEQNWDFGFVQVSTDGGLTWTSLNDTGDYCTEEVDMDAMPGIVANVPGITGWSEEDVVLSFDLSAYDGQKILVGFRYMTDWAFSELGWFIYGVSVDGVEVDLSDMKPIYPEVDWMVTILVPGTGYLTPMIIDIPVNDLDEIGYKLMATLMGYEECYVLISPNMGPVNYGYGIEWRVNDKRMDEHGPDIV